MFRWILRLIGIGFVGSVAYSMYGSYQGGYFNMPEMPEGSYAFSFKSGFRGIVLNAEVTEPSSEGMPKFFRRIYYANPDRRYLGVPFEVSSWMNEAWSVCTAPTEDEKVYFTETMPDEWKAKLLHTRFEAVCLIEVDGEKVLRGLLHSAPRL